MSVFNLNGNLLISIFLVVVIIGSLVFSVKEMFSTKKIEIDIELDLYCYSVPQGSISDFSFKTNNVVVGTVDNITMNFNSYKPLTDPNFSYLLTIIFDDGSANKIIRNYTISEGFNFQGNYNGVVKTSFELRGNYILKLELNGTSSEYSRTCHSKTVDITIL